MRRSLATAGFVLAAIALLTPRGASRFPAQEDPGPEDPAAAEPAQASAEPPSALERAWQRSRLEQELVLAEATGKMLAEFEAAKTEMTTPLVLEDEPLVEQQ